MVLYAIADTANGTGYKLMAIDRARRRRNGPLHAVTHGHADDTVPQDPDRTLWHTGVGWHLVRRRRGLW